MGQDVKMWEENGEIFVRDEDGNTGPVLAGWWNGCSRCGNLEHEIKELAKEKGELEACKYAISHLLWVGDERLCLNCRIKDGIINHFSRPDISPWGSVDDQEKKETLFINVANYIRSMPKDHELIDNCVHLSEAGGNVFAVISELAFYIELQYLNEEINSTDEFIENLTSELRTKLAEAGV